MREKVDIITAYQETGSYRATAAICGVAHTTVRRLLEQRQRGELVDRRRPRAMTHNTDAVLALITEKVRTTDGRITAKRLLPLAQAAGYGGSARNFRRAVARVKRTWRRQRRVYRPWVPRPGEHLVIDWGEEADLHIFCAVLAWSRFRFVRFAGNERRETTLALLVECFEQLGGVPAVVLADRMGCLKAGTVASVVIPHPEYVRFAAHFGFRPDFCEPADPESKGVVENLVAYAKSDLVVPAGGWPSVEAANREAVRWCIEVNERLHSEIQAHPAARLMTEREVLRPLPSLRPPLRRGEPRKVDRLSTVRFGSARYSVPNRLIHAQVDVSACEGAIVIQYEAEEVARHPWWLRVRSPFGTSTTAAKGGAPAARSGPAARSSRPFSRSVRWPSSFCAPPRPRGRRAWRAC
jgi:transposase